MISCTKTGCCCDQFKVILISVTVKELELLCPLFGSALCLIWPCGSRKDTAIPWAEIREPLIELRFAMSAWVR